MTFHSGRFRQDRIAWEGDGFPSIQTLQIPGSIASYISGVDGFFVPPSILPERHGVAIRVADAQIWYGTAGVGATTLADNFILQLVDTSADAAGAGTVSTTGTALTGSGTAFTTLFAVGDQIRSGANTFKITAIASDTAATLEAAPAVDWSTAAYFRVPKIATLATFSQARNLKYSGPQDLRTSNVGLPIAPGQGVRLDVGALGLTYSPFPKDTKIRLALEMYSIQV